MFQHFKLLGFLLVTSVSSTGGIPALHAATSATLDILPNDVAGVPERVEVGTIKPLASPSPEAVKLLPSGNPLWSIPLSALTATRERPIFSAARRPPRPAVAGPRIEPVVVPLAKAAEPEHPTLALIGAVVGDNDAVAVFIDRSNQGIVRLRAGDTHSGWLLSSVLRREVTLKKADQVEVLTLQRPEDAPSLAGNAGVPILPTQTFQPAQAPGGVGYAPFIPRSTPKNGESDGL